MANRNWAKDFATLEHGLVELDGWFKTDNTGAITASRLNGFTVTKNGTGLYDVKFTDVFMGLVSLGVTMGYNGTAGNITNVSPNQLADVYDVNPVPTITLATLTNALAAANTTQPISVFLTFVLKNSSVVP